MYYETPKILQVARDSRTQEEWDLITKQQKKEARRKNTLLSAMYFALWLLVGLACAIGEHWCVLFLLIIFL